MRYLFLMLFVLAVFAVDATAQRNFKPGYIIGLKGDTTKGFVNYREWGINPEVISFKADEQAVIQQLSVRDIAAFGINLLEEYHRYVGPISRNTLNTRDLINGKDTTVVIDTVFLKQITTGKYLTLFKYTDLLKDRFFVSDGGKTPEELKFYKYFNRNNTTILTEKAYLQQLQRFVSAYQTGNLELINKVQASEYTLKDMYKVVGAINGDNPGATVNNSSEQAVQFFVGVAANVNTFTFKYPNSTSKSSVLPQLNLGANVYFNKNVRKLFFRPEINITASKAETYSSVGPQQFTFDQLKATVLSQFMYNAYNTEKTKLFLGGGLGLAANKYSNVKYLLGSSERPVDFGPIYMAVAFKAGLTLRQLEAYAGYTQPLTTFVENTVKRYSFQFGVNYFFR